MSTDATPKDPAPKPPPSAQDARRDREAAALRENLRRRKEQARARKPALPPQGSQDS